jgi:polyhydroxyalkanoate synthesis regulator phasin
MNKEDYKKLVDYMNVEITKAYIEHYISFPQSDVKMNNIRKNDSIRYKTVVVSILDENSLEKSVLFDRLKETLDNNNFKNICQNITKKYDSINKAYYSKAKSDDDLINKLFDFKLKRDNKKEKINIHPATKDIWEKWKEKIVNHINFSETAPTETALTETAPTETASTEALSDSRMSGIGKNMRNNGEKQQDNTGSSRCIIIIVLLSCAILFVFFLKKKTNQSFFRKVSSKERTPENSDNNKLPSEINDLEERIKYLEERIKYLEERIKYPEERIKYLEERIKDLETKLSSKMSDSLNDITRLIGEINEKEERKSLNVSRRLYMSAPNKDGSFWDRNSREELDETASCYKFVETSPGMAEFFTVETATFFQQALRDPDIIDPVCETLNALTNDKKRIITETPGKAQKNGEKWNVIQKARIRYE